jgi:hypothetical protein
LGVLVAAGGVSVGGLGVAVEGGGPHEPDPLSVSSSRRPQ